MMIPPETVEQIRQAVDIVEVIDGYVPLKRSGSTYKALSPFNKEKTPSFFVNPQKQIFKCFSSGNGGDVFKFIMLYENVDFPTAVRKMAEKAGIPIPEQDGTVDRTKRESRGRLLSLHAEIATHWRELLLHDPRAQQARAYLKEREIPLSWAKEYGLGFAPEAWDDTVAWAREKKYEPELLFQAGLVKRHEESGRVYDFFRGRLIFPITNESGEVIAFSARLLDPEAKAAKYVNSPETPLFTKSRVLFGFHRAKRAILDADRVVVCEGQIDVLRCHAAGILHVVAPLGTSFTADHAKILRRFTRNVVICLDADNAGQKAAERLADVLLGGQGGLEALVQSDLGIQVVELPAGHDPDSFIRKEGGSAFQALLDRPTDYLLYLIRTQTARHGGDIQGRRRVIETVAAFLGRIPNQAYREQLIQQASIHLGSSAEALTTEIQRQVPRRRADEPSRQPVGSEIARTDATGPSRGTADDCHPLVRELVELLLARPEMAAEAQRTIAPVWLAELPGAGVVEKLYDAANQDALGDINLVFPLLTPGEQRLVAGVRTGLLEGLPEEGLLDFLRALEKKARLLHIRNRELALAQQMKNPALGPAERAELMKQQTVLLNEKKLLTSRG
ncbi:MAG: DNA primase [Candidatus Methylacidiphilales bacterium]|nr:DNA primase [Candidatus Methylacidiphilales bacterium]